MIYCPEFANIAPNKAKKLDTEKFVYVWEKHDKVYHHVGTIWLYLSAVKRVLFVLCELCKKHTWVFLAVKLNSQMISLYKHFSCHLEPCCMQ